MAKRQRQDVGPEGQGQELGIGMGFCKTGARGKVAQRVLVCLGTQGKEWGQPNVTRTGTRGPSQNWTSPADQQGTRHSEPRPEPTRPQTPYVATPAVTALVSGRRRFSDSGRWSDCS